MDAVTLLSLFTKGGAWAVAAWFIYKDHIRTKKTDEIYQTFHKEQSELQRETNRAIEAMTLLLERK